MFADRCNIPCNTPCNTYLPAGLQRRYIRGLQQANRCNIPCNTPVHPRSAAGQSLQHPVQHPGTSEVCSRPIAATSRATPRATPTVPAGLQRRHVSGLQQADQDLGIECVHLMDGRRDEGRGTCAEAMPT